MKRWKQRAMQAEAQVATLRCDLTAAAEVEAESSAHVSTMIAEADTLAEAYYTALEQIREADHGHPRNAAGSKLPSGRCPICSIVAEVGV